MKKTTQKLLSLILALLICLSLFPVSAFAAEETVLPVDEQSPEEAAEDAVIWEENTAADDAYEPYSEECVDEQYEKVAAAESTIAIDGTDAEETDPVTEASQEEETSEELVSEDTVIEEIADTVFSEEMNSFENTYFSLAGFKM